MAEFSENRHISNLINMSCKVTKSLIENVIYKLHYSDKAQTVKVFDRSEVFRIRGRLGNNKNYTATK